MIVTKRQAKAPIGVSHFITACRLPKEDTGLIEFNLRLNSNRKKGDAAQSLNLHTEQLWFSLASENTVLAFKKFLFLLKHKDGSVIHSKQLNNPFCNLIQLFSRFFCTIGQLEHPYVTLVTAK